VLRKAYLGRSPELTQQRLEEAAQTLASEQSKQDKHPYDKHPHDSAAGVSGVWTAPLIATKITIPQPGPTLIARPSVVERLLEDAGHPCALITAPAGFGKTTALIQACEQLKARGWRTAWVSLEEAERDPVRFWTYALAALDDAQPGVATIARRSLATLRPTPIETTLTALINALAVIETPIALVLDDYHQAASPASDQGLAFLIEHAPAALHLIIATRDEPAIPLTRLRAQGRLAELHVADLRFSLTDAERFMHNAMRLTLPEDQLARLVEKTEGWVAGLQLAALSLREQATAPELSADFATPPHYIAEYLIDEVLARQPTDVQTFLLQTSPLDRLTAPLCDAVTGRTDSAAMLARLTQAQLFTTPLDSTQTWYRYHQLFAEALRERLEAATPATLTQCHLRAATWLQQNGMTGEAIHHLLVARAFADAALLIEREGDQLALHGETAGLVAWARALPRAVVLGRPHLCMVFALALFLQSETSDAVALLDDLEALGTSSSETWGEIAAMRAILTLVSGDFFAGAALAREAAKQLPPTSHLFRSLALWITNGIGLLGDDNLSEVANELDKIAEECLHVGNLLVGFIAMATKAAVEAYQGRLRQAEHTCRESLRVAPRLNGQETPIAAQAYCLLGEIFREWNNFDDAEREIRRMLADDAQLLNFEFMMDGLISLALLQAERGAYDDALETLEDIRHQIRVRRLAAWDLAQTELARARVLIMHGQIAEAAIWAEETRRRRTQESNTSLALLYDMEDLTIARVALAQGRAEAVFTPLRAIREHAAQTGRMRHVLEAEMLLARAYWQASERDEAIRHLDASLAIAAPEGFIRVFLDEGESLADLLAHYVVNRSPSRERSYALKLLEAFGRIIEPETFNHAETLSSRELDVLRLLAVGRSNEAIASELVVALSTVKWHVAHIYRKLGVAGRMQAVARARELRLIA
ncbi:MAG TPA: LuxR C-terminal-related transcriptional regulator, partial [Ktedonobacterales bacterium]|nr:LuxR C-terminal-related transcriptional regulator [Ktedonobacterales bacterium]